MKQGVHMFKEHGFHVKDSKDSKNLMRILLISALGRPSFAMAVATSSAESFSSLTPMAGNGYGWLVPLLFMLLCLAVGMCTYLRFQLGILRREFFARKMEDACSLILDRLQEGISENHQQRRRRYLDSELWEVSDPEYWMSLHHGDSAGGESEDADMNDHAERAAIEIIAETSQDLELLQTMRETNEALRARRERLEAEWDEAEARHDIAAMEVIEHQIAEVDGMMYRI